ncbi:MAG: hypothetical protein B7Y39_10300 [Bdellovibrio sp. 28-41-41]|nr:MAG: hypothetical protein B7Y39_10300 [Bdellovibrio sp. 28-41-41]
MSIYFVCRISRSQHTRVAPDSLLNVKKIGDAAASLRRNPNSWADRGNEKDVLQELKLLWHVLLRFGDPIQVSPQAS